MFTCAACGKIEFPAPNDSSDPLAGQEELEQRGEKLPTSTQPIEPEKVVINIKTNTTANLFVCGEPSMMGFADWKYETIYETAVSLLLDRLSTYSDSVNLYRYDKYNISTEDMSIPDVGIFKNDIHNLSFYTAEGLTAESDIPSSVVRYKERDQLSTLNGVDAYIPAEIREAAASKTNHPFETAIGHFKKGALNIVVTDLYELREGGFSKLNELEGYEIGILAVRSEYAGRLPDFVSDGTDLLWGSPRTGSYKSHEVKTGNYTKKDGTIGVYKYNVFAAYNADERKGEGRTFYIIFAGNAENADNIGNMMSSIRSKIIEKYSSNPPMVAPPNLGVFGFFSARCDEVETDADAAKNGYIVYPEEDRYEGAYSYEIRESDYVPALRFTAKYPVDTGAGAVIPTKNDFEVESLCMKLGEFDKEHDSRPILTIEKGNGFITPILTYNSDKLPKGEYLFETTVSAKPVGQTITKDAFLDQWGVEIDDGTLSQMISGYNSGGQDDTSRMGDFMLKTRGLSYLFEHINEPPSKIEILKVKLYIKVV
jgi:hypothetical protein